MPESEQLSKTTVHDENIAVTEQANEVKRIPPFLKKLILLGLIFPPILNVVIHFLIVASNVAPVLHLMKDPNRRGEVSGAAIRSVGDAYHNQEVEQFVLDLLDRIDEGRPVSAQTFILLGFSTAVDNPFFDFNELLTTDAIHRVREQWNLLDQADITHRSIEADIDSRLELINAHFPEIIEGRRDQLPVPISLLMIPDDPEEGWAFIQEFFTYLDSLEAQNEPLEQTTKEYLLALAESSGIENQERIIDLIDDDNMTMVWQGYFDEAANDLTEDGHIFWSFVLASAEENYSLEENLVLLHVSNVFNGDLQFAVNRSGLTPAEAFEAFDANLPVVRQILRDPSNISYRRLRLVFSTLGQRVSDTELDSLVDSLENTGWSEEEISLFWRRVHSYPFNLQIFLDFIVEREVSFIEANSWQDYYRGFTDSSDLTDIATSVRPEISFEELLTTSRQLSTEFSTSEDLTTMVVATLETNSNWLSGVYGSRSNMDLSLSDSAELAEWFLTNHGDQFQSNDEALLFLSVAFHDIRYRGVISEEGLLQNLNTVVLIYGDYISEITTEEYQTPDRFTYYALLLEPFLTSNSTMNFEDFSTSFTSFEPISGELFDGVISPIQPLELTHDIFDGESSLENNQLAVIMPWSYFLGDDGTDAGLIEPAAAFNAETNSLEFIGSAASNEINWVDYMDEFLFFIKEDGSFEVAPLRNYADQVSDNASVLESISSNGVTSFFVPNFYIKPNWREERDAYVTFTSLDTIRNNFFIVASDDEGNQQLFLMAVDPIVSESTGEFGIDHRDLLDRSYLYLQERGLDVMAIIAGDPGYGVYGQTANGENQGLLGMQERESNRVIVQLPESE